MYIYIIIYHSSIAQLHRTIIIYYYILLINRTIIIYYSQIDISDQSHNFLIQSLTITISYIKSPILIKTLSNFQLFELLLVLFQKKKNID